MHFSGLPSPAAAASIAGFAILFYELRREGNTLLYADEIDKCVQTGLPFFALLVALLMVSRIPYPHVVNQVLRGQRSFGHVVALVFAFVAIMSIQRLFGADHRLRVRACVAAQISCAARVAAARNARPDFLIRRSASVASMFTGLVQSAGHRSRRSRRGRPANGW